MITRKEALAVLTAPGEPYEIVETVALGRKCRVFKNAPATLGDIYAQTRSGATFLVYDEERLTFEDTWRRACTLAHALASDYGVKKGDRVAISMRNFPEWMISFMAATSMGAVAVAMNAMWQPHEMEQGLKVCGARVLLADQERLDRLAQCADAPKDVAIIGVRTTKPLASGVVAYEDVMARAEHDAMPGMAVGADDLAIMLFTSGSTGAPKGAVSTHRSVVHALLSWELDAKTGVMRGILPAPVDGAPQTIALLGIPLFHVTGLHAVTLTCFRYQRRVVSMFKWDALKAAELIERERITHFTAPSAVTGDLVEVGRAGGYDLTSLVSVGGGGAARATEQVKAIPGAFGSANPSTGWGMTETNAIGTGIGFKDYLDHPESSGQCSAVLDIRIAAPDGTLLGPMQRGELQIRGTSMMQGYWQRPEATAESLVDGDWFKTGDVAYIDHDGFVYIVDRLKDLVIRGGENIGCGAVEGALTEHPDILEACVYGVPDDRLGEEVGATIYATTTVDPDEVRAFLGERIARFMVPRYITVSSDPLPRIATGKIAKRQLRAEAVEAMAKQPA